MRASIRDPAKRVQVNLLEIINLLQAALDSSVKKWFIGGWSKVSIDELTEKIIAVTESNSRLIHSESVKGDAEHTLADNRKAVQELG